jgi:hypothetical protein
MNTSLETRFIIFTTYIYIYIYIYIGYIFYVFLQLYKLYISYFRHQLGNFLKTLNIMTKNGPILSKSVIYSWFYTYTPADGQQDRNTQWFESDIIMRLTHWCVQCNHLLCNGQNIACCMTVEEPWLYIHNRMQSIQRKNWILKKICCDARELLHADTQTNVTLTSQLLAMNWSRICDRRTHNVAFPFSDERSPAGGRPEFLSGRYEPNYSKDVGSVGA